MLGIQPRFRGALKMGGIIGIGFLLIALMSVHIFQQQRKLLTNHQWVVHTLQVRELCNQLTVEIWDGVSSVRGYLLTGNPDFLASYRRLNANLPILFADLKQTTQDNPSQQSHLQALEPVLQERLRYNQLMVESYPKSQPGEKMQLIAVSEDINRQIKNLIGQMRSEENRLMAEREARMQTTAQSALVWIGGVVFVMALAASFLFWSLVREWRQRQAMVRQLALMNSELENRNINLHAANEAISSADRLKTEFLSAMSHELRTPLNSIIGFTGILRMGIAGALNEEQNKQLNMVNDSAQHLLHLINDLLDLSRIESGRAELSEDRFDLREVVAEALAVVAPLAAKKKLTLSHHCGGQALPVKSDRRKVYQILLNLVNNAVKFSEQGKIEVMCHESDEYWQVCVSDEGIGIRAEYQDDLFQAFRQVDGSARRVYEGTGLGLYLSKKLVEMLGGDIGVTSTFGKGSRFCFTLPRRGETSGGPL